MQTATNQYDTGHSLADVRPVTSSTLSSGDHEWSNIHNLFEEVRHDARLLRQLIRRSTRALSDLCGETAEQYNLDSADQQIPTTTAVSLSHRETEVMEWVAQGKSNGDIATILGISPHTVDTHLRRAFAKLDTYNRTVAAIRAVQCGLVSCQLNQ